jgi:hypothetical protein
MSMELTVAPTPEIEPFVTQLRTFRETLSEGERSLLDAVLLAAAQDAEAPLYVDCLAELRRALPDARRPGLEALLVAASAPAGSDV